MVGEYYSETSMKERLPIRFGCMVQSSERRPGFLTWLIAGLVLCAAIWMSRYFSLTMLFALVGFVVLVFLPALCGSFLGWFLGGVRNVCRQFRHHRKIERSFR